MNSRNLIAGVSAVAAIALFILYQPWVTISDAINPWLTAIFWIASIALVVLLFQDRKNPGAEVVEVEGQGEGVAVVEERGRRGEAHRECAQVHIAVAQEVGAVQGLPQLVHLGPGSGVVPREPEEREVVRRGRHVEEPREAVLEHVPELRDDLAALSQVEARVAADQELPAQAMHHGDPARDEVVRAAEAPADRGDRGDLDGQEFGEFAVVQDGVAHEAVQDLLLVGREPPLRHQPSCALRVA